MPCIQHPRTQWLETSSLRNLQRKPRLVPGDQSSSLEQTLRATDEEMGHLLHSCFSTPLPHIPTIAHPNRERRQHPREVQHTYPSTHLQHPTPCIGFNFGVILSGARSWTPCGSLPTWDVLRFFSQSFQQEKIIFDIQVKTVGELGSIGGKGKFFSAHFF